MSPAGVSLKTSLIRSITASVLIAPRPGAGQRSTDDPAPFQCGKDARDPWCVDEPRVSDREVGSTDLAAPESVDNCADSFLALSKEILRNAVEAAGASPESVTETTVQGNPVKVLIDASDGADLFVVGNRGHRNAPGVGQRTDPGLCSLPHSYRACIGVSRPEGSRWERGNFDKRQPRGRSRQLC